MFWGMVSVLSVVISVLGNAAPPTGSAGAASVRHGLSAVSKWPAIGAAGASCEGLEAMGDVLADYVNAGGRVILGRSTLTGLAGRIMTPAYCPVAATTPVSSCEYAGDGVTCIFHGAGGDVDILEVPSAAGILTVQPGALWDGTICGHPAAAYWPQMNVFTASATAACPTAAGNGRALPPT
jgi:hypothetical protein